MKLIFILTLETNTNILVETTNDVSKNSNNLFSFKKNCNRQINAHKSIFTKKIYNVLLKKH